MPANSMAAFQAAVDMGYDYVETDVRATSDGVLLVFHDATLDRMTDRSGVLADLPYREVAKARLADGSAIPQAADVVGAWPALRLNIDAKDDRAVDPLLEVLAHASAYDRVCITAFSDGRIRRLRRALPPRTATALARLEVATLWLNPPTCLRRWCLPDDVPCVQVPVRFGPVHLLNQRFLDLAHDQDRVVHAWTIDDPVQMHALLDLGVDGIITDNAPGLLEVLDQRRGPTV